MKNEEQLLERLTEIRDEIRALREQNAHYHDHAMRRFESRSEATDQEWKSATAKTQYTWIRYLSILVFLLLAVVVALIVGLVSNIR